jgi:hypothetical protein
VGISELRIATLPRLLAVEVLLAEPEALQDDILESCLYLLRDRLQGRPAMTRERDTPERTESRAGKVGQKGYFSILAWPRMSGGAHGALSGDRGPEGARLRRRKVRRGQELRLGAQVEGAQGGHGGGVPAGERREVPLLLDQLEY